MKKLLILSTLLVAVLAVVGVVFALNNGGDTRQDAAVVIQPVPTTGGPVETAKFRGVIEYWVRDAQGNLKENNAIHNVDTLGGHIVTTDRLFDETVAFGTDTANDAFRAVVLNSTATTQTIPGIVTAIGTKSTTVGDNPKNDGVVTCASGPITAAPPLAAVSDTGRRCTIEPLAFLATAGASLLEFGLIKAADASSTFVAGDFFATQGVIITLAQGDSLTVRWTVDLD